MKFRRILAWPGVAMTLTIATVAAAFLSGIISTYQIGRIRVFFNQDTTDPALKVELMMQAGDEHVTHLADSGRAIDLFASSGKFHDGRGGGLSCRLSGCFDGEMDFNLHPPGSKLFRDGCM